MKNKHDKFLDGSIVLMIYTANYYFPSSIVIYLWYVKTKDKKVIKLLYTFAQRAKTSIKSSQRDGERGRKHLLLMRAQEKRRVYIHRESAV